MKRTFFTLFDKTIDLINMTIYILISLAVLGFMWGIVKILFNADNEVAKKEGRSYMLYGILTLFVMTSMWGLVNILNGTIDLNDNKYIGDVNTPVDNPSTSPEQQFPPIRNVQDILNNNEEQVAS